MTQLELSTQIAPTLKFTVDDEPYDMLGLDHLSREKEAHVVALFALFERLNARLYASDSNLEKSEKIAARLHDTRIDIVCALTTVPRDVAAKLPPSAQGKLMEAIKSLIDGEDDEDVKASPAGVQSDE